MPNAAIGHSTKLASVVCGSLFRHRYRSHLVRSTLNKLLSLTLIVTLTTLSASAAPPAVKGVVSEGWADASFWLRSNGLATATSLGVLGDEDIPEHKDQEEQEDRNARVKTIVILPGDITIELGERVAFTASAYDKDGELVGGVPVKWEANDLGRGFPARISPRGDFEARIPGKVKVTAEVEGKKAHVTVMVAEGFKPKRDPAKETTKDVSSRDIPQSSPPNKARKARGGVTTALMAEPSYDNTNYWSADDPGNRVGDPPGAPSDDGAGSGNFQLAAPVLALNGRGINLTLALSYNSRMWSKAGSQITYDIDKDWPAPGWSLGLGKMIGMGVDNGSMLIDADGTHHSYTGTVTYGYNYSYTIFNGRTTDGKFIDYSHQTGTGGALVWGEARLSDGTQIQYGATSQGALYPTRITNANGNYITITYVNNRGPQIQTITDTLGRAVNFHYDANNLLTAITGPGLGGTTQTLVRLHYRTLPLNYGFYGLTPRVGNSAPWVIDAVYYPATNTGYWFGDTDSYSSYGMISKTSERRGMSLSASSLNVQGTVSPGSMSKQVVYNYPMSPNYSLTDAPTYATMTETADQASAGPAVTSYSAQPNANPRRVEVTHPNGTKSVQLSYNAPGQFNDGLVYEESVYNPSGTLLNKSTTTWALGAYNSPRPVRTEIRDERGQVTATEVAYGPVYNQVTAVRNYDYGGVSLLRTTSTQYENGAPYTGRHIFNLPKVVETYAANGTRASRTEYEYDGMQLVDTPGVVMHDDAYNPYAPQYLVPGYCYYDCIDYCYPVCEPDYWTSDYNPATDYRGNITKVTTYADAVSLGGAVTETKQYDINGNMIVTSTSCCEQTSFNYTSATQYGYPVSMTRGSASNPAAQLRFSTTYDFNTGLVLSNTDPNGRTSQTTYFAGSLRPQKIYLPTAGYRSFSYDDAGMAVTETSYTAAGAIASQNIKRLNGQGQLRREEALGNGGWDVVETTYDASGRVWKQTRPYRSGSEQPQWNEIFYDALDRVTKVRAPDGSESNNYYNEVSRPDVATPGAQGQTTRVQDAWGKEMWARADADGQLAEVVEPNPSGTGAVATGGLATRYSYNVHGKLTAVTQGSQQRSFRYDSLGRLTHQRLAEQSATLNDSAQYVGSGLWSEVLAYDERSNLVARTDARGVKAVFSYNNDPLNRLQSISYDTSGFGDTGNPIATAATITYEYMTAGDVTRIRRVNASGVSTEDYAYDVEGRVNSKVLTLTDRPSHPQVIDYIYDSLGRVTDVRYPAQYGFGSAPRKVVQHTYDAASRLSSLQVDGINYASQISYDASSQTKSLSIGNNQTSETYTYDAATGMLSNQKVQRAGATLLDMSYDYLRPSTTVGRTGQLTKISNNLDHNKDRSFVYDPLGRLTQVTGGLSLWSQTYAYDRYGNRTSVTASGNAASTPAACAPNQTQSVEQFVGNFYQRALNRQPNTDELQHWSSLLRQAYWQGGEALLAASQNLGWSLFQSQEYTNRGRSNSDYVYDLYWAYLQRTPDAGGWSFWTNGVAANGRDSVRRGFDFSTEFANITRTICPNASSSPIPRDGLSSLTYNAASNRITTAGFAYDAAGNQTRAKRTDGSWERFQYDAAGRMVNVKTDSGFTLASYTYGSSNHRLRTQDGEGGWNLRTYYAWDGDTVISEYTESRQSTSSPQWSKNYIFLGERLLSVIQSNAGAEEVQYHHPDRLGTRLITNSVGAGVQEQAVLPFGTALDAETTGASKKRFTSYDRSAMTGLDYAVNRHYDSHQGRFTQVDPLGMGAVSLAHPQTLNLYSYCANDPVNRLDHNGMFWGKLKRFFKKVGKIFSAIGKAISKVLNNRWVRIGIFIAGFILPGLSGVLYKVIDMALKIYNKIADIAAQLQLWGSLLEGKGKEFLMSIGMGIVGAAIAQVEDAVIKGMQDALFKKDFDELADLFVGAWNGFTEGISKLGRTLRHAIEDLPKNLIPFYGMFCSPANVDSFDKSAVDGYDGLCKSHDKEYQKKAPSPEDIKNGLTTLNAVRRAADWTFVRHALFRFGDPKIHLIDIAFGGRIGRPSVGSVNKFLSVPAFIGLGIGRSFR